MAASQGPPERSELPSVRPGWMLLTVVAFVVLVGSVIEVGWALLSEGDVGRAFVGAVGAALGWAVGSGAYRRAVRRPAA